MSVSRLLLALLLARLLVACGGARPTPTRADPEASSAAAADAWSRLAPERALTLAEEAIAQGGGDDAREIAARAALATGEPDRAVRALAGVGDDALLRLRAAAQIAADDREGAIATLEAAARRARVEDPWASAVLPALRAARAPYGIEGDDATLPLLDLPLPVIAVRVDTVETLAVLGTGAHFAVLDPSIRNAPGAIDELGLGALRVRSVPHVVRSLEPLSAALGRPIGMVIGADLLLRLAAVIDGPAGRVRVHASPPPSTEGTGAGLLPLSGSFLAVEARLDGAPAWLTLDTAGLFPLALTPSASDALEGWRETDGVELVLLDVRIGALEVRELPAIRGLLDDGHARAIGAPVSGSLGWGLLGQLVIAFDPRARRIRFDGSRFEESRADP